MIVSPAVKAGLFVHEIGVVLQEANVQSILQMKKQPLPIGEIYKLYLDTLLYLYYNI